MCRLVILRFSFALVSLPVLLVSCSKIGITSGFIQPDPTQQFLKDSRDIYGKILAEIYPQEEIFVIDHLTHAYEGEIEQELLPEIKQDTVEAFEMVSKVPNDLRLVLELSDEKYTLIDPIEFTVDRTEIPDEECYWMMSKCFDKSRFNLSYPKSSGFIQLSNIGFNSDRTQALATVEMHNQASSGTIYIVLLSFVNGSWEVQEHYEVFWIV
jgi:hypothetical protein